MARLQSYWRWLGHRLRLSHPGRVFFTVALLVGVAGIVDARVTAPGRAAHPSWCSHSCWSAWSRWMPSAGESSLSFAVSSWTVGSGAMLNSMSGAGYASNSHFRDPADPSVGRPRKLHDHEVRSRNDVARRAAHGRSHGVGGRQSVIPEMRLRTRGTSGTCSASGCGAALLSVGWTRSQGPALGPGLPGCVVEQDRDLARRRLNRRLWLTSIER